MSDKPIENLAVGWLPGVNVPAHPPDAVSGAATPSQQADEVCSEVAAADRLVPGARCTLPHGHSGCHSGDGYRWADLPAATPEAQIPECVHAPETHLATQAEIRSILTSAIDRHVTNESLRDVAVIAANCIYRRNRRIDGLESQLAALRVERDQAQMLGDALIDIAVLLGICQQDRGYTGAEALQLADDCKIEIKRRGEERDEARDAPIRESLAHVEELADAWERGIIKEYDGKGGTRSNRNHDLMIKLQRLARPIPAEPSHE